MQPGAWRNDLDAIIFAVAHGINLHASARTARSRRLREKSSLGYCAKCLVRQTDTALSSAAITFPSVGVNPSGQHNNENQISDDGRVLRGRDGTRVQHSRPRGRFRSGPGPRSGSSPSSARHSYGNADQASRDHLQREPLVRPLFRDLSERGQSVRLDPLRAEAAYAEGEQPRHGQSAGQQPQHQSGQWHWRDRPVPPRPHPGQHPLAEPFLYARAAGRGQRQTCSRNSPAAAPLAAPAHSARTGR
ncbi:hypothetical protein ACVIW2_007801 [Bradyrhizobium huanghuaihaiense]|uniref:Uncharacterized protein n=1 Tax=Bradyrhizobium huanghuaihaiense TaxID=990078 RepID=A0A562RQP7_9BRAD|nr:hypothetical protein IQ16_03031 [Bradyrhizobium huanghuaihaiense]